jgi:hypothetical protein
MKAMAILFAVIGLCANGLLGLGLRGAQGHGRPETLTHIEGEAAAQNTPELQEAAQTGEELLNDVYHASFYFLVAAAAALAVAIIMTFDLGPRWLAVGGLLLTAALPLFALVRVGRKLSTFAEQVQRFDPTILHPSRTRSGLIFVGIVCAGSLLASAGFAALVKRPPTVPA